jgi:DNA-binding SARP family transcriptional activator/predicted ATPase
MLHLHLFGPPHIARDDRPVSLDTRKATALLAYLAVTGQRHSRDTLATLLYPDAGQSQARAALRRTLSSLRAGIGEPWLAVEREAVALSAAPGLWCDVDHFLRALADCQRHGHNEHEVCPRCLVPLAAAVALYRDDFLAGFSLRDSIAFDQWQTVETERLRRLLLRALAQLVRGLTQEGRLAEAIDQALRLLAIDPLHEPAHRLLMLLYTWTGQPQNAQRQYRECVRVLGEELGVSPLPETTQVYEAVKERRIPPPPAPLAPALPTAPASPERLPLTGRSSELATLHGQHQASRISGRLAALVGEAGIGKTRLAEEFTAQAQASGSAVLAGRCHEGEAGLAYGVLVEALRSTLARPELAPPLAAIPERWLAEAARLLPELGAGRALPAPAPLNQPGAPILFFEGLCQTIQALAGPGGVLWVDDAQWIDSASLDLLAYLARRLASRPLLLLLAWRAEESPTVQRLAGLAHSAQRVGQGCLLTLGRLTPDEVARLAAGQSNAALAGQLYRISAGLPLFVSEYLRAGQMNEAAADAPAMPQGVRSLLQARLAPVDEAGHQLLAAAAVIGRSCDFATLRAVSGRSEEETLDCLERLLRQGLVLERADGYDFSHEQLRALVYGETSLARRRLLHRRMAETLQRQVGPTLTASALASQIGHHFWLAGQEAEAALHFWRAGQQARTLFANAEALSHLETALALGYPDTAALHEAIGDLQTLAGRYALACAAYEQAAAIIQAHSPASDRPLASIERKLGLVHQREGEWELAASHFRASQHAWPVADAAGLAHLLADRSLNAHRQGNPDQAELLAAEALQQAERANDVAGQVQARNALGILARGRGDLAGAAAQLRQGLTLAGTLDDGAARVALLNNLALVCQAQGDVAAAIEHAGRALVLGAAQGDRHREAALRNNLADLLQAAGQPDAAMDQLKQAVAIFAEIGQPAGAPDRPEIWKLVEW